MQRSLYDYASVSLTPTGPEVRLVIAPHVGTSSDPAVGTLRDGVIYEMFVSTLPVSAFMASDVLDLSLHRGSFETVLVDEDDEQASDRWYSHTPCGQEFAHILAQWVWNLRLELGQTLSPSEPRTTEFAPPCAVEPFHACEPVEGTDRSPSTPAETSGPPQWARPFFTHSSCASAPSKRLFSVRLTLPT